MADEVRKFWSSCACSSSFPTLWYLPVAITLTLTCNDGIGSTRRAPQGFFLTLCSVFGLLHAFPWHIHWLPRLGMFFKLQANLRFATHITWSSQCLQIFTIIFKQRELISCSLSVTLFDLSMCTWGLRNGSWAFHWQRDGIRTAEVQCVLCKGDFEDYVLNFCCLPNTSAVACTEER